MAANLAKWPSNRGLISKIRPSDGCKGNTVPSTVVRGYDLRKPGGHLGNVGLVTENFLRAREGYGDPSTLPVLIVGMPRSGTTLVEQIIASHPEAHGAGELQHLQFLARRLPVTLAADRPYPDCLDALTRPLSKRLGNHYMRVLKLYGGPGKTRVVDKMWANYLRLGLVALIAPNSRVFHCRRDPMDTCASCYFQNFAHPLPFLHDLSDLGFYYRQYTRLMDHWAAVKPLPILDVEYEALVANQEDVTREIIAFCGLDWHDRCLTFQETDRFVPTASSQQVRRPIYRSSIGRWRNYEKQLGPLKRAIETEPG